MLGTYPPYNVNVHSRSHTTPTSPSIGQALIGNITLESAGWCPVEPIDFVGLTFGLGYQTVGQATAQWDSLLPTAA